MIGLANNRFLFTFTYSIDYRPEVILNQPIIQIVWSKNKLLSFLLLYLINRWNYMRIKWLHFNFYFTLQNYPTDIKNFVRKTFQVSSQKTNHLCWNLTNMGLQQEPSKWIHLIECTSFVIFLKNRHSYRILVFNGGNYK